MFIIVCGIILIPFLVYYYKKRSEILDSEKFKKAQQTITEIQTMVSKHHIGNEYVGLTRDETYYECTLLGAEFLYATNPNITYDYFTYKKECLEKVFSFDNYPNIDKDEFVKGMWIRELPPDEDDTDLSTYQLYIVHYKLAGPDEFAPNELDMLRKKMKITS